MIRHFLMAVALVTNLAGCMWIEAPGNGNMLGTSPAGFAHQVGTSEVLLLWNCTEPGPGLLRVEGVAKNPWQAQPIGYLEFELVGVDSQERTTSRTTGAARNPQLFTNQSTSFQLILKRAGAEVRFDLYYQYRFRDEFDMSSLVAGPPMAGPFLLAQTQTHLVRDVCGATQHRTH